MQRDMTQIEYEKALARHGFVSEGFMGYYRLPIEGHHFSVSALNAGHRRRARLAYLLRQLEREQNRIAAHRIGD